MFEENEDFQTYWLSLEYELKDIEADGYLPETDQRSGGKYIDNTILN